MRENTGRVMMSSKAFTTAYETVVESDVDEAGRPDAVGRSVETSGWGDRLVRFVFEQDNSADGSVDGRVFQSYRYDHRGNLIGLVEKSDWGADGVIDEVNKETYTYDRWGNPTRHVQELDFSADGDVGPPVHHHLHLRRPGEPDQGALRIRRKRRRRRRLHPHHRVHL